MPGQALMVDEAKSRLAELIAMASEGGEVIIPQNDTAVVRLVLLGSL